MSEPGAMVARLQMKPGRETDYEAWLERLTRGSAEQVEGRQGAEFHRPGAPRGEYRPVFRFDGLEFLDTFERSDFRRRMLAGAAPLFTTDAAWERMTGLGFGFNPPPGTRVPRPSPHLMALALIALAFCLVLTLNLAPGPSWRAGPCPCAS